MLLAAVLAADGEDAAWIHGLSPEVARDLTKAYPNPIGEIVNLVILRTRGERIRARHPR